MLGYVKLIECFRTFQGEGPDAGKAVLLLRFKYCNKNCSFCDTNVKMRITNEGDHSIQSLQSDLTFNRLGLMITGGEPTFKHHYDHTLQLLTQLSYPFANVETNGFQLTRMLSYRNWEKTSVKFIYSPKIFDEKSLYEAFELTKQILDHQNVYIKVLYWKNDYVDQYCRWLASEMAVRESTDLLGHLKYHDKVWLMPLGDNLMDQEESSSDVMDACEKYRFNFSGRLHTMYNFI